MLEWYRSEIIATGRQPVLFALLAFIITLLVTRMIVRLIRSGKGPFGNVSAGDVHVHHVVPGIVLMGIGGLIGLAASERGPLPLLAGILFGAGAALVLDEFPLILHLDDVYWDERGKLSVEATTIAVAVFSTAVIVASPALTDDGSEYDQPVYQFIGAVFFTAFTLIPLLVALLKGKVFTAAVGWLFPPLLWVAMIRLAKPASPWAIKRYPDASDAMHRARQRHARTQARVQPFKDLLGRLVFGFRDSHDSIER